MRPALVLTLIACCCCVFLVRISATDASPQAPQAVKAVGENQTNPPGKSPVFKQEVEGFGEKDDDARSRAVERACDVVADYLRDTHNETDYKPKAEYLLELKIIPPMNDLPVTNAALTDLPNMKKATLQLQVSADSVKKMCNQAREQRAEKRQHWMGLSLAGVVAFLLVAAGYLRLEEATKGYYTGLLRLTALVLLGMAAGVIWYAR
jgi:hypothetical protein